MQIRELWWHFGDEVTATNVYIPAILIALREPDAHYTDALQRLCSPLALHRHTMSQRGMSAVPRFTAHNAARAISDVREKKPQDPHRAHNSHQHGACFNIGTQCSLSTGSCRV